MSTGYEWINDLSFDEVRGELRIALDSKQHYQRKARENEQAAAQLAAAPLDAITHFWQVAPHDAATLKAVGAVGDWLIALGPRPEVQP